MADRIQAVKEIIRRDNRPGEVTVIQHEAFQAALRQVPEAAALIETLKDVRGMGRVTAAGVLFDLFLYLERNHAWPTVRNPNG